MHAPRKGDSAKPRPRLSVTRSELRFSESRLGREPRCPLAHPLEYEERGSRSTSRRLPGPGARDGS
jgi:hypothetical protein